MERISPIWPSRSRFKSSLRASQWRHIRPTPTLRFFCGRPIGQRQHLPGAGPVDGRGLLHEDVDALVDGVAEVDPAEGAGRGEEDDVARPEAVHGLLVGIEAEEPTVGRDVDLGGVPAADRAIDRPAGGVPAGRRQRLVAHLEPVLEHVGHRHELDRAAPGGERIGGGPGAATAAADQRELDRVALSGMHGRQGHPRQGRRRDDAAGVLQKPTTRRTWILGGVHGRLLGGRASPSRRPKSGKACFFARALATAIFPSRWRGINKPSGPGRLRACRHGRVPTSASDLWDGRPAWNNRVL